MIVRNPHQRLLPALMVTLALLGFALTLTGSHALLVAFAVTYGLVLSLWALVAVRTRGPK